MDQHGALARVKQELSRRWWAAGDRIAALAITEAHPAHCGEFELRSVFVDRTIEPVEEPLGRAPAAPSQPLDAWAVHWPPATEHDLQTTHIDVRSSDRAADAEAGLKRASPPLAALGWRAAVRRRVVPRR